MDASLENNNLILYCVISNNRELSLIQIKSNIPVKVDAILENNNLIVYYIFSPLVSNEISMIREIMRSPQLFELLKVEYVFGDSLY